jgi:uncharacterized protein YigA (DUF484 family)
MSTLKHQHAANPEISEDSIADYLQANPEFFERHSSLLNNLRLPHDAGGPTVSLVERQILVLRQKNLKLENKLKELVDIARGNDALAGRIHSLAMLMLAAPDQAGVIKVLEEQLRGVLQCRPRHSRRLRRADRRGGSRSFSARRRP